nr:unknown [Ipomoea trifida]
MVPFGSVIQRRVNLSSESSSSERTRQIPKSLSLVAKLEPSKTFAGFRSPWTRPWPFQECRNMRAARSSDAMRIRVCHGSGGVLPWLLMWSSRLPLGRYS